MESNKEQQDTLKSIIFVFIPLLAATVLRVAVNFIDIIVVFLGHVFSKETHRQGEDAIELLNRSLNQPMNRAYVTLFMHLAFLLVFGIWYYRAFKKEERPLIRTKQGLSALLPWRLPLIIVCGVLAQFFVGAALLLARGAFPKLFVSYDEMVSRLVGANASWVTLLATFLVAPIAEEFLFRGVVLGYARTFLKPLPAVLVSAVLFGLYHGNVIQFCYAFVIGTALGALACRFDNLLPGMLLHIAINVSARFLPDISSLPVPVLAGVLSGGACLFTAMLLLICKNKVRSSAA